MGIPQELSFGTQKRLRIHTRCQESNHLVVASERFSCSIAVAQEVAESEMSASQPGLKRGHVGELVHEFLPDFQRTLECSLGLGLFTHISEQISQVAVARGLIVAILRGGAGLDWFWGGMDGNDATVVNNVPEVVS